MSDWEKNRENALKLNSDVMQMLENIHRDDVRQSLRIKALENSKDFQYDDINLLSKRIHILEKRFHEFERFTDSQLPVRVEFLIRKKFSDVPIIKKIYVKPTQSDFLLVIVHNAKTISDAIGYIRPRLDEIEDEFPDLYFDPWILRPNEIQEEQLRQSKLIYEYDDD